MGFKRFISQTNTDLSRAKFERDRRQCAEQEGELNRGGCCEGGEDADDDADDADYQKQISRCTMMTTMLNRCTGTYINKIGYSFCSLRFC